MDWRITSPLARITQAHCRHALPHSRAAVWAETGSLPSLREAEKEPVCYLPEQMAQIAAEAKGKYRVLFATAAETGVRAGELYALEVRDIDIARCIIHVRRAAWEGIKQSLKSQNAYRAIDVLPSLIAMLKEHLNGRTEGLVFRSENGQTLRNTYKCSAAGASPYLAEARHSRGRNAWVQAWSGVVSRREQHAR